MDRVLFSCQLVQIYESGNEGHVPTYREPLSLLYALLALGRRYKASSSPRNERDSHADQGLKA